MVCNLKLHTPSCPCWSWGMILSVYRGWLRNTLSSSPLLKICQMCFTMFAVLTCSWGTQTPKLQTSARALLTIKQTEIRIWRPLMVDPPSSLFLPRVTWQGQTARSGRMPNLPRLVPIHLMMNASSLGLHWKQVHPSTPPHLISWQMQRGRRFLTWQSTWSCPSVRGKEMRYWRHHLWNKDELYHGNPCQIWSQIVAADFPSRWSATCDRTGWQFKMNNIQEHIVHHD